MIEILGFAWIACIILAIPITLWNVNSFLRMANSQPMKMLNLNLAKVDMFWSASSDCLQKLQDSNPQEDLRKALRGYYLLGGLGFFSLPGLAFLILVSLTMHRQQSSLAKLILNSELAKVELEPKAIQDFLEPIL